MGFSKFPSLNREPHRQEIAPMSPPPSSPLDALPHGPEFRFLDNLVELEPGVAGMARYRIQGDEGFLAGHFPGNPMMPGVLLIEAIAQLGGVIAQSDPTRTPLSDLRLTAVRAAKILGAARPGEALTIRANLEGRLDNLVQVEGSVAIGERMLATAKIVLSGT
jgi:3-hydroxyacyl-[acyl-carrier-protein] dehydratase